MIEAAVKIPPTQAKPRRTYIDRLGTGQAMYATRPLIYVTGSRYATIHSHIETVLRDTVRELIIETPDMPPIVIHGNNRHGVDHMAEQWCLKQPRRVVAWVEHFDAHFDRYGNEAGPYRNGAMAERCLVQQMAGGHVVVLAFPAGNSSGTRGAIEIARGIGLRDIRVRELGRDIARQLPPVKGTT